jgi:hypothetical protein
VQSSVELIIEAEPQAAVDMSKLEQIFLSKGVILFG